MNQPSGKDNEFKVKAQVIIDGKQHDVHAIKVVTSELTPEGHYNQIKSDLIAAYKERYPNSAIAIVIVP